MLKVEEVFCRWLVHMSYFTQLQLSVSRPDAEGRGGVLQVISPSVLLYSYSLVCLDQMLKAEGVFCSWLVHKSYFTQLQLSVSRPDAQGRGGVLQVISP